MTSRKLLQQTSILAAEMSSPVCRAESLIYSVFNIFPSLMLTLMNEALFQFIWKMRLFDHAALNTTDGEAVDILHPGTQNHHAGPDFQPCTYSHRRYTLGGKR